MRADAGGGQASRSSGVRRGAESGLVFEDPPPGRPRGGGPGPVAAPSARPHGTRAKYVLEDCRCGPCRAANRQYSGEHDRARRQGTIPALVPADRARAHLERLAAAGMGRRRVAGATGLAASTVEAIRSGRRLRVRPGSAEAILAVAPERACAPTPPARGSAP